MLLANISVAKVGPPEAKNHLIFSYVKFKQFLYILDNFAQILPAALLFIDINALTHTHTHARTHTHKHTHQTPDTMHPNTPISFAHICISLMLC